MFSASPDNSQSPGWHATTILSVRKDGQVVMAGDGQVSMGQTIVKGNAKKVRRLGNGQIVSGFAGSTADAFTLFERLESKLERHPGQLLRACIELAKDWRTDRYLRRLEAMMAVADKDVSLLLSGSGDVLEPEGGIIAIGSGGNYALPRHGRWSTSRAWMPRRSLARRWASPPTSASTPTTISSSRSSESAMSNDFSPREIVSELDKHIVGQQDAKRAVAIALRNRWRRLQLPEVLREEVLPKNILMIGPDRSAARPRFRAVAWPSSPMRRSSRSKPPSSPKSAMSAVTSSRSPATWWRPASRCCAKSAAHGCASLKAELAAPRNRVIDALVTAPTATSEDARCSFRQKLRGGDLDDKRDRDRGRGHGQWPAACSRFRGAQCRSA